MHVCAHACTPCLCAHKQNRYPPLAFLSLSLLRLVFGASLSFAPSLRPYTCSVSRLWIISSHLISLHYCPTASLRLHTTLSRLSIYYLVHPSRRHILRTYARFVSILCIFFCPFPSPTSGWHILSFPFSDAANDGGFTTHVHNDLSAPLFFLSDFVVYSRPCLWPG